jgi:hypothetical protein
MIKEAVFTMKLEPQLRADFISASEAVHRPASQVLRELMREFVQRQQHAREYDEVLQRKVDAARLSVRAGLGRSNADVETDFAQRRAGVMAIT